MSKHKKAFIQWFKRTFKNEGVLEQLGFKMSMEMAWSDALSWELKEERKNLESHVIFSLDNRTGQMEALKWVIEQCEQPNNHFVIDCRCFNNEN